jgi:hypothetical protein
MEKSFMTTKTVRRGWLPLALLCAFGLTCLAGCGVRRIPVSGTVTVDGQPLNGGILCFAPDTAKGNTHQINCEGPVQDGHYELQTSGTTKADTGSGVPLGWYKVYLRIREGGGKKKPQAILEVNEKFKSLETTTLSVEVKDNPDPDAYNFKLTK